MAIRDIIDCDGQIVGHLEMPDDTTEECWAEKLSHYCYKPAPPTFREIVDAKKADAERFGKELIELFKFKNIEKGITQAGKTKVVSDYCHWLNHYLEQGSLYAAIEQIDIYLAQPDRGEAAAFVTDERLNYYKSRLQTYLGILPS